MLGLFDEVAATLTEEKLQLLPGDRLALYTDGLTDVMDPNGAMLGPDALADLFVRHADLAPADLAARVAESLDDFRAGAEQADDMTLLVVAIE